MFQFSDEKVLTNINSLFMTMKMHSRRHKKQKCTKIDDLVQNMVT